MDTIDLLRQAAARASTIQLACQKINEGITELCAALAPTVQPPTGPNLAVLSPRQGQIFEMIKEGIPKAEIARRLKLNPRTIDSHRDTMRKALGFRNIALMEDYARSLTK